mmetsp:Transcript_22054/g.61778  ORF Transcript_22054/g.61778 Transcript_22054/m.61778 type:complete len:128 (+) Transcript_22054:153-536(+)
MGNCEGCKSQCPAEISHSSPMGRAVLPHSPITSEQLSRAVRDLDLGEVRQMLHAGVDVNEEIDDEGHTVLDLLVAEHMHFLSDHLRVIEPDFALNAMETRQKAVYEMFHCLRVNGAVFGGLAVRLSE